jgi:protoporphyrinogen oxidase
MEKAKISGQKVELNESVIKIEKQSSDPKTLLVSTGSQTIGCKHMISSMPLNHLIQTLVPAPPENVLEASKKLKHRDFLTVALVVPKEYSFPDNWIYIHSPEVRVGRVQNYGSWSPFLIKENRTCLGLEYFVNQGDDLWESSDEDLIKLGTAELKKLGLAGNNSVETGYVVRVPRAYPVYDSHYLESVETIRNYLALEWPSIYPVGRNGMHRYNNQDHSMLTAMLTADNIALSQKNDVWAVNLDDDYHEETSPTNNAKQGGRLAPIFKSR